MLKLRKDTLTELTSDQMSAVVGGTAGALTPFIHVDHEWESCFAASCVTND